MSAAATARPTAAAHGGEIDILRSFARRIDPSDAGAYNNLGVLYATGQGVPQDDAEAVRWYRLAAEQEKTTWK